MTGARTRLAELIRAVERGEKVVIARHGKPVAQLTSPAPARRHARLGGMKGRIRLLPGWDGPIDLSGREAGRGHVPGHQRGKRSARLVARPEDVR